MENVSLKSVAGLELHCFHLLSYISCHKQDSLTFVVGKHEVNFNLSIVCSLSPLLSSLVKGMLENGCCSSHDHIYVSLPDLQSWKTLKLLQTFLSCGVINKKSGTEVENLQKLIQMLGLNILTDVQPTTSVEDEELQYIVVVKYEVEDENFNLSTGIQCYNLDEDLVDMMDEKENDHQAKESTENLLVDMMDEKENDQAKESTKTLLVDMMDEKENDQAKESTKTLLVDMMDDEENDQEKIKLTENLLVDMTDDKEIDQVNNESTENIIVDMMDDKENCQEKNKSSENITMCQCENTVILVADKNENNDILSLKKCQASHSQEDKLEIKKNTNLVNNSQNKKNNAKTYFNRKDKNTVKSYALRSASYQATDEANENVINKDSTLTISSNGKDLCWEPEKKSPKQSNHSPQKSKINKKCKTNFRTVQKEKHIDTHKNYRYSCVKCDFKAQWKQHIKTHVEVVHKGIRYPCSECDFQATRKDHLKRHAETVHKGVRCPCSDCDFQATQKRSLKNHVETVHKGVVFSCGECDYKSQWKGHVKTHVEVVHKGIRYSCSECDYQATRKTHLKRHVKTVHKCVRCPCVDCDFQATQKINLKRHIEAVHNGVTYSCGECDYKAKLKKTLKWHVDSVHKGVTYSCSICDYKAKQKSHLKRHLDAIHKGIPWKH